MKGLTKLNNVGLKKAINKSPLKPQQSKDTNEDPDAATEASSNIESNSAVRQTESEDKPKPTLIKKNAIPTNGSKLTIAQRIAAVNKANAMKLA